MRSHTLLPIIGTSTYNIHPARPKGIFFSTVDDVLCLHTTCTFNPTGIDANKSLRNVTADDPNFQELLKYRHTLQKIIVFIGKKDSGSLEIIRIFCKYFESKKLFFALCDHDLSEKESLLADYKIPKENYIVFIDGHTKCQEDWVLDGLTQKFARELQQ